ncbi:hypothetical protein FOZ62_009298 [Perkinsus olseni]|uniref:Uncharacterized protein n=1 Tax=Perkinsus olseni TaxID=32597 RepID=A0A7J6RGR2_PEROL|nr:hypothetical protein FOZ62_009298 [Perkinsus olseni]
MSHYHYYVELSVVIVPEGSHGSLQSNETVDEGGWEVDDSLMDENTPAAANEPTQSTIRCCSPLTTAPLRVMGILEYPDAAPIAPIVPSLPPPPPEGYVLAELSDDEYIIADLSP